MAFVSLLGPYFVARHRLLSIGLTTSFMQTTTVLRLIRLGWPDSISAFLSLLSPVNWFIQFVSPECSLDMDYFGRWLFRVCVPFLVIAAFALFSIGVLIVRTCKALCAAWCHRVKACRLNRQPTQTSYALPKLPSATALVTPLPSELETASMLRRVPTNGHGLGGGGGGGQALEGVNESAAAGAPTMFEPSRASIAPGESVSVPKEQERKFAVVAGNSQVPAYSSFRHVSRADITVLITSG